MTHLRLISELQDTCWAIERISKQLTTLSTSSHSYQPLLSLLQRNNLEVCILLKKCHSRDQLAELIARISELTRLISLMRDYAFDGMEDERVEAHLTQIKEGLEQCLALIIDMAKLDTLVQNHTIEVV